MIYWPAKAPGETEDFAFDFSGVLQSGETIIGTPEISPSGVTAGVPTVAGGIVTVWLSGGAPGAIATVECTVVTNSTPPRTYAETAVLPIGDEVVSLASMKAWLRVEQDSEDELISDLIADAVDMVEDATSKNLTPKIATQTVDGFPGGSPTGVNPAQVWPAGGALGQPIRLYKGPVSQVISIAYDDPQGVEQALTSFRLVEGVAARLLPAAGALWPLALAGAGTVRIAYLAGFAPGERPRKLERAVRMLVAHWYQNREAVVAGNRAAAIELPLAVSNILDLHRSPGLA